jgi:hypothetical protein
MNMSRKSYKEVFSNENMPSNSHKGNDERITIHGKFKSANLFNDTIHIILYPHDGLRNAVSLQKIDEWTDVTLNLTKNPFKDSE